MVRQFKPNNYTFVIAVRIVSNNEELVSRFIRYLDDQSRYKT